MHLLAQVEQCLIDDWKRRYASALLETCYRAANWIRVGKTQGQLDVKNEYALPVNWLKPLRRDWKKVLNR